MKLVAAKPPGQSSVQFAVHERNDAYISNKILRDGNWERFETQIVLNLLRGGDQVLDIGANIGWYSVAAGRQVGANGLVIAFEPDTTNCNLLRANIDFAKLTNVVVNQIALGLRPGFGALIASMNNQGDVRIRQSDDIDQVGISSACVPVVRLDDYLKGLKEFDLNRLRVIKIDVQGFEFEVLRGSVELLSSLPERTVIFLEFDPLLLSECHPEAGIGLIDLLSRLHRRIFEIVRPIWRLREISGATLEADVLSGITESKDLVIAHESMIGVLWQALPFIARNLSRRLR